MSGENAAQEVCHYDRLIASVLIYQNFSFPQTFNFINGERFKP
jgi:hypothetical protein